MMRMIVMMSIMFFTCLVQVRPSSSGSWWNGDSTLANWCSGCNTVQGVVSEPGVKKFERKNFHFSITLLKRIEQEERENYHYTNIPLFKKSVNVTRKKGLEPTWLGDMGSQLLVNDSWFLNFPSKLLSKSSTENLQTALPRMALRGVVNTP